MVSSFVSLGAPLSPHCFDFVFCLCGVLASFGGIKAFLDFELGLIEVGF